MPPTRDRVDRCPGVLRPWAAEDGLLVRLRLIGGRISTAQALALLDVAERFGDGALHPTSRTNLQLRALPGAGPGLAGLAPDTLAAIESTGLLPSRTHELVRNVMVSPQTGLAGGRADLRPLAVEVDRLVCASPALASLPGRFLIVLDDGRGDLVERASDLGVVALDGDVVQLRVGLDWAARIRLAHAARALVGLAEEFQHRRGTGVDAPWHVAELDTPLLTAMPAHPQVPDPAPPLPFGAVPGGLHVEVPAAGLDRAVLEGLAANTDHLILTPWRGILVPEAHR